MYTIETLCQNLVIASSITVHTELVPLDDVMASLPGLEDSIFVNSFLLPQLDQDPDRRPSAQWLLDNCPFLQWDYGTNPEAFKQFIKATDQ